MRSKADYQRDLTDRLSEALGVAVTWTDLTLSDLDVGDGTSPTVTVLITGRDPDTAPFSGSTRITLERMDLRNASFVFDYRQGNPTFGSPVWSFEDPPTTLNDNVALLRTLSDVDFEPADFDSRIVREIDGTVTRVTLTAKPTSLYYYGSVTLGFTYPWAMEVRFIAEPPADVVIPARNTVPLHWWIDGVHVTLPYTLTAGKHTVTVRGITRSRDTTLTLSDLTPTRVTRIRAIQGDWRRLFANCTALHTLDKGCISTHSEDVVLDELFLGCTALTTLPNVLFQPGSTVYSINGFFEGSGLHIVTGDTGTFETGPFNGLILGSDELHRVFAKCLNLTLATHVFDGMENVVTISDGLFVDCPALVNAEGNTDSLTHLVTLRDTYRRCTSLRKLTDTYPNNSALETVEYLYQGCTAATDSTVVFAAGGSLRTVLGLFQDCTLLDSAVAGLLTQAVNLEVCRDLFRDSGINYYPDYQLFLDKPKLVDISGCFAGCKAFTHPPRWLMDDVSSVEVMDELFRGCGGLPYNFQGLPKLTRLRSARYAFADSTYVIPRVFELVTTELADITGMFQNSQLTTWPTGFNGDKGPLTDAAYAFANTPLTAIPKNALVSNVSTAVTLDGLCQSCTALTEVVAGALSFTAPTLSAAHCFEGCSQLTTVGASGITLTGNITTVAGFFKDAVRLKDSSSTVAQHLVLGLKNGPTDAVVIKDMFNNCAALTGTIAELYRVYFGMTQYNDYRYPDDFVEMCFLLSDYGAYGRPWWTTPKRLSAVTGGSLDIYTLGNVRLVGGYTHVPLFVTYHRDVDASTVENLLTYAGVTNAWVGSSAVADMLKTLFTGLGLTVPTQIQYLNVKVWTPGSGSPPSWVRDGTTKIVAMVFDRRFNTNEGVTDLYENDVYAFTVK